MEDKNDLWGRKGFSLGRAILLIMEAFDLFQECVRVVSDYSASTILTD